MVRAIDPVMDLDRGPDEVPAIWQRQQLYDLPVNRDCVVVIDSALEAFAKDISEICAWGEWAPSWVLILGFDGEAQAVIGDELFIEVTGCLVGILDVFEAQLRHQAILEGAVDSLAPSPGLW